MAVRMIGIGRLGCGVNAEQANDVGGRIDQRVKRIGQHRDRAGQRPDEELDRRDDQIEDHDADQHALDGSLVLSRIGHG